MRSKAGYQRVKLDTMRWKRRHKKRTRYTQYKTVAKNSILNASPEDLIKYIHYFNQRIASGK